MIRLRADTRALLEKASSDQRRSMASLVDESIKEHLSARYAPVSDRITRFLGS